MKRKIVLFFAAVLVPLGIITASAIPASAAPVRTAVSATQAVHAAHALPACTECINWYNIISGTSGENAYMTTNGDAGDGYIHGNDKCGTGTCNDQGVSFYAANGNSSGGNEVTCSDGAGWWPFRTHSLDTANCGNEVKYLAWISETHHVSGIGDIPYCAFSNTSDSLVQTDWSFADSKCMVTGGKWVSHTNATGAGYINVYQSDTYGGDQWACFDGTIGNRLKVTVRGGGIDGCSGTTYWHLHQI